MCAKVQWLFLLPTTLYTTLTTFINNTHSTPPGGPPQLIPPMWEPKNQSSLAPLPTRATHAPPPTHLNACTQFQFLSCHLLSASLNFCLSPTLLFRLHFRCVLFFSSLNQLLYTFVFVLLLFYFGILIIIIFKKPQSIYHITVIQDTYPK